MFGVIKGLSKPAVTNPCELSTSGNFLVRVIKEFAQISSTDEKCTKSDFVFFKQKTSCGRKNIVVCSYPTTAECTQFGLGGGLKARVGGGATHLLTRSQQNPCLVTFGAYTSGLNLVSADVL